MREKIIIYRRNQSLLVKLEMLLLSAFSSYWLCKKFDLDWILGGLIFLGSIFIIGLLFFRIRVFRYVFAIIFSLAWGALGFAFATVVTKSTITPWILFAVVFGFSLVVHRSHLRFETSDEVIRYSGQ